MPTTVSNRRIIKIEPFHYTHVIGKDGGVFWGCKVYYEQRTNGFTNVKTFEYMDEVGAYAAFLKHDANLDWWRAKKKLK